MITKKDIDSYKSITAPPELKQRILREKRTALSRRRSFSGFTRSAAAACIVLLGLAVYTRLSKVSNMAVSLGGGPPIAEAGQPLTGGAAAARSSEIELSGSRVSLHLDLSVKGDTEISVSEGSLSHFDNNGTESQLGTSTRIHRDTELVWTVELSEPAASPQMTLKGQENQASYIITFNKEAGEWIILKE